jgi:hypothetical protein
MARNRRCDARHGLPNGWRRDLYDEEVTNVAIAAALLTSGVVECYADDLFEARDLLEHEDRLVAAALNEQRLKSARRRGEWMMKRQDTIERFIKLFYSELSVSWLVLLMGIVRVLPTGLLFDHQSPVSDRKLIELPGLSLGAGAFP